jgi:hypothetical protein
MYMREKWGGVRGWWQHAGRSFVGAQWRRVGVGCIVGAVTGIGVHLLTREARFASFLLQDWAGFVTTKRFDGFRAYKAEALALCLGMFALAAIPTLLWLWRFVRAWRAWHPTTTAAR